MWYIYVGIVILTVFLALLIDSEVSPMFFYCPTCGRIQEWARMTSKQSYDLECRFCKVSMERRYIPNELFKLRRKIWIIPPSITVPISIIFLYLALTMKFPFWGGVVFFFFVQIFVMIGLIIYCDLRIKRRTEKRIEELKWLK